MSNSNLDLKNFSLSSKQPSEEELHDALLLIGKLNTETDIEIDYKPPPSPSANDVVNSTATILSMQQMYEDIITKLRLISKESSVMSPGRTMTKAMDNSCVMFSIGDGIEEAEFSPSEMSEKGSHVIP